MQVARPTLRHARGRMSPDSPTTRRVAIPAGVVLTDMRIEGQVFADGACDVWIYTIEDAFMDVLTTFRLSAAEPFAEFHLESGFLPSPTTDSYGFALGNSSNCIARVFWTGYSVP